MLIEDQNIQKCFEDVQTSSMKHSSFIDGVVSVAPIRRREGISMPSWQLQERTIPKKHKAYQALLVMELKETIGNDIIFVVSEIAS